MGVTQGADVGMNDVHRANAYVAEELSFTNRVRYFDISGMGANPDDEVALKAFIVRNDIDCLISLRLDSVIIKERRDTRTTKDGGKEEYSLFQVRTNYDITFLDVAP